MQSQHQNVSDTRYIGLVAASHARHKAGRHWMKDADFDISIALWCLYCIVVRRSGYTNDPDSYTSRSVATGRVCLAGQVKGRCQIKTESLQVQRR